MIQTAQSDRAACALSIACILHCLALPVIASFLPAMATIAEAEWVHWLLAVFSIGISLSVPIRDPKARKTAFMVPAIIGVLLIGAGLFAENFEADETIITVIGGSLVAFAHIRRLLARH